MALFGVGLSLPLLFMDTIIHLLALNIRHRPRSRSRVTFSICQPQQTDRNEIIHDTICNHPSRDCRTNAARIPNSHGCFSVVTLPSISHSHPCATPPSASEGLDSDSPQTILVRHRCLRRRSLWSDELRLQRRWQMQSLAVLKDKKRRKWKREQHTQIWPHIRSL